MNNENSNIKIDKRFNIPSYEQFLEDNKTKKFNKLCMTEVINADMSIATFGEQKYFDSSAEILAMGNMAYVQMGIDHLIKVYAHTYKSFMAVANDEMSDDDFYNLMKANHEQYELITASQTGLGGVSRFVLVFGNDLVDRARSTYFMNKKLPNNFIVASDEREKLLFEAEKNIEKFELLNHAINNDKVVPFYQGIYNNDVGEIGKYEALMRIYDKEGNVYPPGMFLEAAKKLKLYIQISKILIDKALKDFEGKRSELGLNISIIDIESEEFRKWFINRLLQHPTPEKVVIEFVETENYNNNDDLFCFLNQLRNIGCKIAIDDFGVGFATYTSIVSLKPEVIKIDGDIVKNLATNEDNQTILKSIKYMADLIKAKTTAEFVEDATIQEIVVKYGINNSQGYHFAKPLPKEQLDIK